MAMRPLLPPQVACPLQRVAQPPDSRRSRTLRYTFRVAARGTHRKRFGRRRILRYTAFVLIAALYLISIPWYRDTDAPLRLWLGLPDWAAVALVSYTLAAAANAFAWRMTEFEDSDAPSDHNGSNSR